MDATLTRIDRVSRDHPFIALRLVEQFAAQARLAKRVDLELDALYVRYLIHERRGENDVIADDVAQGLRTATELGLSAQGARLLQAQGRIAQVHGRYQQAIEAWMQALELATLNQDYVTAVEARIGLSQANNELKNATEARRYLFSAQADVERSGDKYLQSKYAINCGVSCLQFDLFDEALNHFKLGLLYAQHGHVREYIAESYWHIGHVEMELGLYSQAQANLAQAIKMAQQFGYLWLESVTLDSQAQLFGKMGNLPAQISALHLAYQLAERTSSLARQLDYAVALVDAYEKNGEISAALHWARFERQLSQEHFKRSLLPVHRAIKALDLTEQDVQEKLLMLSVQENSEADFTQALEHLLTQAQDLLKVDWLGVWFLDHFYDLAELVAESPKLSMAAKTIGETEFPIIYRYFSELCKPLPISRVHLHEAANEFKRLLGGSVSSLLLLPIHYSQKRGLLVLLSHGEVDGLHTWTRDDVFKASLLQQILQQRLANQARQQLQSELERHDRVNALGALVAAVAHQLNTPVGICITISSVFEAELLALDQKLQAGQLGKSSLIKYIAVQQEMQETLTRNLRRVVELIDRFREIQDQQIDTQWQSVRFGKFLQTLVRQLIPDPQHIKVEFQGDIELETKVPMMAFAQILAQLLDNSIRHAFVNQAEGVIELIWSRKADQMQLIYQDNGVGIATNLHHKIFDPFFTSQFGQGSHGLGLTRVYQLVTRDMMGSIRAEANNHKGLRIILTWTEPGVSSPAGKFSA